jgi:hypothetical protein
MARLLLNITKELANGNIPVDHEPLILLGGGDAGKEQMFQLPTLS